jgi:hypothetical protein
VALWFEEGKEQEEQEQEEEEEEEEEEKKKRRRRTRSTTEKNKITERTYQHTARSRTRERKTTTKRKKAIWYLFSSHPKHLDTRSCVDPHSGTQQPQPAGHTLIHTHDPTRTGRPVAPEEPRGARREDHEETFGDPEERVDRTQVFTPFSANGTGRKSTHHVVSWRVFPHCGTKVG